MQAMRFSPNASAISGASVGGLPEIATSAT
jgi:hypothetical protein